MPTPTGEPKVTGPATGNNDDDLEYEDDNEDEEEYDEEYEENNLGTKASVPEVIAEPNKKPKPVSICTQRKGRF